MKVAFNLIGKTGNNLISAHGIGVDKDNKPIQGANVTFTADRESGLLDLEPEQVYEVAFTPVVIKKAKTETPAK